MHKHCFWVPSCCRKSGGMLQLLLESCCGHSRHLQLDLAVLVLTVRLPWWRAV